MLLLNPQLVCGKRLMPTATQLREQSQPEEVR